MKSGGKLFLRTIESQHDDDLKMRSVQENTCSTNHLHDHICLEGRMKNVSPVCPQQEFNFFLNIT